MSTESGFSSGVSEGSLRARRWQQEQALAFTWRPVYWLSTKVTLRSKQRAELADLRSCSHGSACRGEKVMVSILFVDDEPTSTVALRLLLEAKGFQCECLTDMSSALEFLRQHEVAALVSDIMMPSGNSFPEIDSSETGFHFVAMVRREFPHLGVVCLSVIGDQSKINSLKRQGVLYLRKGETPLNKAARIIESKATGITRYGG